MSHPRTTLARPDLAALSLQGQTSASRFAAVRPRQCAVASAAVRAGPEADAELLDQLIFGEGFDVLEEADGWAWGQARRDGYVGWVSSAVLTWPTAPTHAVKAVRAYAYAAPDFKSAPTGLYSLNALLTEQAREGRWVRAAGAGWIADTALREIGAGFEPDPVDVALRFLGAPYLWGGRESLGLDCSALVQQALYACGQACPRDTDMQEAELGTPVDAAQLRRGDLVFWNGHVAWMLDRRRVLHANVHAMAVAVEPLHDVVDRMRAAGVGEPTSYRRL